MLILRGGVQGGGSGVIVVWVGGLGLGGGGFRIRWAGGVCGQVGGSTMTTSITEVNPFVRGLGVRWGVSLSMMTRTWLHKAIPSNGRARPENSARQQDNIIPKLQNQSWNTALFAVNPKKNPQQFLKFEKLFKKGDTLCFERANETHREFCFTVNNHRSEATDRKVDGGTKHKSEKKKKNTKQRIDLWQKCFVNSWHLPENEEDKRVWKQLNQSPRARSTKPVTSVSHKNSKVFIWCFPSNSRRFVLIGSWLHCITSFMHCQCSVKFHVYLCSCWWGLGSQRPITLHSMVPLL